MIRINRTALKRSICRESLYDFVQTFWSVLNPGQEPVWNWHIKELCDELQRIYERVFAKQEKEFEYHVFNVPPGSTKSTTFSVMAQPWSFTRMPSMAHICATHTDMLGLHLSTQSRDVFRSELYQQLFGDELQLRGDQDTKGFWKLSTGGCRQSFTVAGKSPTGFHADVITIDDPIDPVKALSEQEIKSANAWLDGTIPSRKRNQHITPIIMVMQRLAQNDPTGHVMKKHKGSVSHYCLPAELTDKVSPKRFRDMYQDNLLDPIRFSRSVLKEKQKDGVYHYAGQFLQNPVPAGGGMFQISKILIQNPDRDEKIIRVMRFWDKAATHDDGAFTVGFKMGVSYRLDPTTRQKEPHYWIMHIIRGQWGVYEREMIIQRTAKLDGKHVLVGLEQEPGSGGKESSEATTRRLTGFRVRVDKPTGDKVFRADPFAGAVGGGAVSMIPGEWNQDLLDELENFPNSTYKDQADAGSGAFNYLSKRRVKVGGAW